MKKLKATNKYLRNEENDDVGEGSAYTHKHTDKPDDRQFCRKRVPNIPCVLCAKRKYVLFKALAAHAFDVMFKATYANAEWGRERETRAGDELVGTCKCRTIVRHDGGRLNQLNKDFNCSF